MADASTSINTADIQTIDASIIQSTGSAQYGLTAAGFVPKPFARLLSEKLATARALFGDSLDLGSGSVIRKLLEISALEDARTWAALASMYDNSFACSAAGEALSRLGAEMGLPRPFLEARGRIKLTLSGPLPQGFAEINIPRGTRLSSPGGHHVATDESVILSEAAKDRDVAVVAFYPGPGHNLDPNASPNQKLDRFNRIDVRVKALDDAEKAAGQKLVDIAHTAPLTGGELKWPDERYRQLLLQAPRSLWTLDAIRIAASLVPGVRQVQVRDALGGLDINQSIFGNFNFIERVFGTERNLGTPYYFTLLVAPTLSALIDGPDGLIASLESAIADLRPIGIFPNIEVAEEVGVGVEAKLVVKGIPLPVGPKAAVKTLLVGWGEGLDLAADYLNKLPGIEEKRTCAGQVQNLAPMFHGRLYEPQEYDATRTNYVLLYVNEVQRGLQGNLLERYYGVVLPLHVVTLQGIDYAWIYENKSYEQPMAYIAAHGNVATDAVVLSRRGLFSENYHQALPLFVLKANWTREQLQGNLQRIADQAKRVWYVRYADVEPDPVLDWVDEEWQRDTVVLEEHSFQDITLSLREIKGGGVANR